LSGKNRWIYGTVRMDVDMMPVLVFIRLVVFILMGMSIIKHIISFLILLVDR